MRGCFLLDLLCRGGFHIRPPITASFVVFHSCIDRAGAVELFGQDKARQLVWQRDAPQTDARLRRALDAVVQPVRRADDERHIPRTAHGAVSYHSGQVFAGHLLTLYAECDEVRALAHTTQNGLALFLQRLGDLFVAGVFVSNLYLRKFDDAEVAEAAQSLLVLGHAPVSYTHLVKVEDGCNRRCAYCVIPRARGPVRSRDEASVLEELRRLAEAGYKEVVLTAISLPSYGTDSGTSLVELIEKAAAVPGIERIRLGSLDPDMLHDEDIRRMAAVKKLCPQFHLSLQSGCDKTLRAMRRPYTTAQYADIAAKLRAAFGAENVSFTTDVIVGFPGETEEDFEASMDFVTGMQFLKVHVFPYSRREGTAAYDFPGQVQEHEKESRSRRMTAAVEEVRAAEVAAMRGRTASVLLETPLSATMFTGYTKQYLPVLVSASGHKTGDIVDVTLGEWDGKRCRATVL